MAGVSAPLPAGLHGNISAVIGLLRDHAVYGEEWAGPLPALRRFNGTIFRAELEFPRISAFFDVKSIIGFAIQADIRSDKIAHAKKQAVADVVDPIKCFIADHVFVAEVGAEVIISEFSLPRPPSHGQGNAEAEIRPIHVTIVFQIHPYKGGAFYV